MRTCQSLSRTLFASLASAIVCETVSTRRVDLVDTTIGTGGFAYADGSINPGVQSPFGALRLGPDTTILDPVLGQLWLSFEHFGGYKYNDSAVRAFSHTHTVGAGVNDWGNIGVTVVRNLTQDVIVNSTSRSAYASTFNHATETASPGLYSVLLETPNVFAELTSSGSHSGAHRYTCMRSAGGPSDCILLVDVCHTTSLPGACRAGNVSVALRPGSAPPVVAITASVLNSGGLTGRGPLGGVWVHWYGELTVGNGSSTPAFGVWADNVLYPSVFAGGPANAKRGEFDNLGAWASLGIAPVGGEPLVLNLRVGISFIDPAHAKDNLYADQAGGSADGPWTTGFDGLVAAAQSGWETWLGRTSITLPTNSTDKYPLSRVFASTTYRALLAPSTYSEWDGTFLGLDGRVHGLGNGTSIEPILRYMSDMSLWDVHRTQMPWLSLVVPEVAADVTRTLLTMNFQGGHLPRWPMANVYTGCMDGSHGIAVMADALFKCTPNVSTGLGGSLLAAIFNSTLTAVETQAHGNRYATLGYVPSEDSTTAASTTLEYAFDDGIAALVADAAGPAMAGNWSGVWRARSKAYTRVWDNRTQSMCPRSVDGNMSCPLSKWLPYPIPYDGYVEGDGAQWQWAVQHDTQGLLDNCWGGNGTAYSLALHELMAGQVDWPFVINGVSDYLPNAFYWAGNEPGLLAPWQFNAAGQQYAWLTQHWSRWILRTYFIDSPDGLPGNDDYGTMSAWAAYAALGLYPIAGTDAFLLGSPSVSTATVGLPSPFNGLYAPQLNIVVHNATSTNGVPNRYVASASANGVLCIAPTVRFADLIPQRAAACNGSSVTGPGLLEFFMTDSPMEWGTGRPLSPNELALFPLPVWPSGVPTASARGMKYPNVEELGQTMLAGLRELPQTRFKRITGPSDHRAHE